MFQKKDFEDFTILELIQKVWEITDSLEKMTNQSISFGSPRVTKCAWSF